MRNSPLGVGMKLAFLHLYLATASGDPRMVLSLAKECKAQGHKVKVYCSEFDSAFLPDLHRGLEIIVVPPPRPLGTVRGASGIFGKILERVRRNRLYADAARRIGEKLDPDFDFVFAENDPTYIAAAEYKRTHPMARAVWIMNNPPFYHSHKNNFFVNLASKAHTWREGARMRRFAKWIDWAVVFAKKYKKEAEALGYKVKLIGNPLDFDYFYAPVKRLVPGKPMQILAVGVLSPYRRFEDLVAATALLRKDGYDVRTVIVCKDYYGDKSYRKSFEECIKASGASGYIDARFEGVEEAEMMRLLRESHVSVAPQSAYVWMATSCEAMAAGMPAIISRATVMPDVLTDGLNALFVDPKRPGEIADKVKKLLDSPELYEKIATAGQRYVKENLNFGEFVKEIMAPTRS